MQDDVNDGQDCMILPRTECQTDRGARVEGACSLQKLVPPVRCVKGTGARTRISEQPDNGADYGFFGRDNAETMPILCTKCRYTATRCLGAFVVVKNGASDDGF